MILESKKRKSLTVSIISPSICHELMDPDAIILGFSMLSFKPAFSLFHFHFWASLVVQLVKNLPTLWETWVWSLGWEDSLEEGKATHYPLQYSGLENFMDRGAWQATVHEVAKSRI